MSPQIATCVYIALILAMFILDRELQVPYSRALWIPTTWLLINGSRSVSLWLETGPTVGSNNLEGSPLDAAVFGMLLLGGVGVLIARRQRVGIFLRNNAPILIFVGYCALSTIWSDYPFVALKRWSKSVGDIVMVLIVLTDANPPIAIKRFFSSAGFILIPLSVLFVKYYPDLGRSYNPWTWEPMYGGVTVFKNLLGMTCLVCALGSLWCFIAAYRDRTGTDRIRHLLPHVTVVAMAIWLLLTADSMTSLSCFLIAGSVMVITSISRLARKPRTVHLLVAAVVGVCLSALFLPGSGLVESLGRDATLTGRTAIWSAVLAQVRNPILGTGFESFWTGDRLLRVWAAINEKGVQEAHNGYIEVYLNLGWIGVTLLGVLLVAGYRNIISLLRQNPDAGTIRLGFFVAGIIYSLTEAGFRMMSVVWISLLLATMFVPRTRLKKVRKSREKPSAKLIPEITASYEDACEAI